MSCSVNNFDSERNWHAGKVAVVLVGLPATGKTLIARNLSRYLRWLGLKTKTFSVAHYRNRLIGENLNANFFDPMNIEFLSKRTLIADEALKDLIDWLIPTDGGQVAILDASNTRLERRKIIHDELAQYNIRIVFLECIYNYIHDKAVTEHIRELQITCPEYTNLDGHKAEEDFKRRIDFYKPYYVRVGGTEEECEWPFIQIFDGGERMLVNKVQGYLSSKMLYYLMNIHNGGKSIFLYAFPTKTTTLEDDAQPAQRYLTSIESPDSFSIWTETSQTSSIVGTLFSNYQVLTKPQLRGLDLGVVENLTDEEIRRKYPEEYERHLSDPYNHRYRRAESYHDLAIRLETIIMELERNRHDVLIMAEPSVIQCIYAYYMEIPNKEIPFLGIKTSSILELRPKAYGVYERTIQLDCVSGTAGPDNFRPFAGYN